MNTADRGRCRRTSIVGCSAQSVPLITLTQLRGILPVLRDRNSGDRDPRAGSSIFPDLTFAAAAACDIPRLAGLSWSELLSAAPDAAWWLIIAATVSLITVGTRKVPRRAVAPPPEE